jgi:hypothetical protein
VLNCVLLRGESDTSTEMMCSNDLGEVSYFFKTVPPTPNGSTAPWGPRLPHFSRLHDHTFLDTPLW